MYIGFCFISSKSGIKNHLRRLSTSDLNHFVLLIFFVFLVGLGVFIYHEKFLNKPQTLEERYASSESEGGISNENSSRRISHIDCSAFDSAPRVNNLSFIVSFSKDILWIWNYNKSTYRHSFNFFYQIKNSNKLIS